MNKASDIDISSIDTQSIEFQNALKLLTYTSQSVFLTGKAGTGKSTFLKYLTATTKKKYVVLAPTGIAAVNAGGQTLHSFFKLPFKPMLPDDPEVSDAKLLRERIKYNKEFIKLLRSLDLIIIDEVSMVRADTIDFIDRILKVYCGNHRQPFAGKQLLLVGDVFQLEPVITGDMQDVLSYHYADGAFFFNAQAFKEMSIVPIELTKVYRQNDQAFISLLDRIRVGTPQQDDLDTLNSHILPDLPISNDDFTMTIATRRDIVDSINETHLNELRTPERIFLGEIKGDFPEKSLPTDKELVLKEGAQVVFVKNDIDRRWVNGTIGRIVGFGEEDIIVELENGEKHTVKLDIWENVKYEYNEEKKTVDEKVIGSFTQYPLKLAWALTIHKSQGLTFDKVIVDVGAGAFTGGQTYVALSRCRSLQGLTLRSTINQRDIFVKPNVIRFSKTFNNDWLISCALENAKADDLYHRAAEAFNKADYSQAVDLFVEALKARNDLAIPGVDRLLKQKLSIISRQQARIEELEAKVQADKERFAKLALEYVDMAETCREEGWDMQAAISNYDKAISLDPEYVLAHIGKGLALAAMEDCDGAVACFTHASKIDPKDHRALLEAGRLLVNAGDLAQGMDYLLHALQRNDKVSAIHSALADGYEKVGDDENASHHRQIAAKLKKNQKK